MASSMESKYCSNERCVLVAVTSQRDIALTGRQMCPADGSVADELKHQSCDVEVRQPLRSASSSSLVVRHTRLSAVGDRAFPIAA